MGEEQDDIEDFLNPYSEGVDTPPVTTEVRRPDLIQRQDSLLAQELYQEEVRKREQGSLLNDYKLGDIEDSQIYTDDVDGSTKMTAETNIEKDEELAKEIHDREVAYNLQIQLDKEFAQSLADGNNQNNHVYSNNESEEVRGARNDYPGLFTVTSNFTDSEQNINNTPPFVTHLNENHMPNRFGNRQNFRGRFPRNRANPRVGDDVPDANIPEDDYEALLALGERLGEVKVRGMDADELSVLPTTKYNAQPSSDGASNMDDKDCKVCMEDFKTNDNLRVLPCLHKYHVTCIDRWIKDNATCPICKLDIKDEVKKQNQS